MFAAAAHQGEDRGAIAFKVYTVAVTRQPIKSQGFVTITPEHGIDDAPPPDILVIPGGQSGAMLQNERFMSWADTAMKNAKLTLTVCTGAFVPAKVGLLDGRGATTHHSAFERLRAVAPRATVIEGKRFVDNGSLVTTAGVSAGIDGALHAVARLLGRSVADSTASYMEYHWTPEAYLTASYPYLNPSLDEHGRALQQAGIHEEAKDWAEAEKAYRSLTERYPRDGWGWFGLSSVLQAKGEWDAAIQAGERAAKFESIRAGALFNVACAYARKGNKDEAFNKLAMAVASGFKKKWRLEGRVGSRQPARRDSLRRARAVVLSTLSPATTDRRGGLQPRRRVPRRFLVATRTAHARPSSALHAPRCPPCPLLSASLHPHPLSSAGGGGGVVGPASTVGGGGSSTTSIVVPASLAASGGRGASGASRHPVCLLPVSGAPASMRTMPPPSGLMGGAIGTHSSEPGGTNTVFIPSRQITGSVVRAAPRVGSGPAAIRGARVADRSACST